jgi:hypothetical protein
VINGARVVLLEDFNKITETKSAENSEFSFKDLRPGTYQVQVKQTRFQIFQQLVPLGAGQNVRVQTVLNVVRAFDALGISGGPPPGAQEPTRTARAVRAGGQVTGPKRLSGRFRGWPEAAVKRGTPARWCSTPSSSPTAASARSRYWGLPVPSSRPRRSEAYKAYKTWKSEPMKLNGQPVECEQVVVFDFRPR